MRDDSAARLRRYLRVAYDAGGRPEPPERAPSRWAAPTGAAARVAAVLIVLVVAGITYLVLVRVPPAPGAPAAPSAEPEPPGGVATAEPTGGDATVLVVHVAGAVLEPGLVQMPAGARVAEAIEVAGGPAEGADLDALNLAAPVVDGQQVYVPREGENIPPTTSGGTGAGGSQPGGGLVNINTADAVALEALPGIGPALAERIIAWRAENGPFPSVDALTNVSGIGPAILARLQDKVTV
ncbi:helix-hairpin-helix domain-containing protein [Pseudactinotalea suaedae]|uniref:helix-hairpin-helix domain-containing protein n=1 Tax=Pseudactinotalea suaedae TaxID=1524924 RepID=UPI0012E13B77|nr:helix-hairpin-helix domain-containing protein [Pseudactinotalea suaedae]